MNTSNHLRIQPSPSHRPPGRASYLGQPPARSTMAPAGPRGSPLPAQGLSARSSPLPVSHTFCHAKGGQALANRCNFHIRRMSSASRLFRKKNVSKTGPLASQKSNIRLEKRVLRHFFFCALR